MNGNNKNMIHDIIHASVDTFKDLHNDSKNFRENAKNNASTSNSSATIPTAQPLTSRFVNLLHIAKLNGRICGAKRSHSVFEQPNCYQSV